MRRLPLASVLLTAHALLLRIQSPADNATCEDCSSYYEEYLYYNAQYQSWLISPGGCGSTSVWLYGSGSGPPELASQWWEYGVGVAGVAGGDGTPGSGASLMTSVGFGSTAYGGFAEALIYGADNGARISSNSWGYTSPDVCEQAVIDAIDYYNDEGGIVVFAAGNDDSEACYYPGCYDGVVGVAALDTDCGDGWIGSYSYSYSYSYNHGIDWTAAPSPRPTPTPSTHPSPRPTPSPSSNPTPEPGDPTASPVFAPTHKPTPRPSSRPTQSPTHWPTVHPSSGPTTRPTWVPWPRPSAKPTSSPTSWPTHRPIPVPTPKPSLAPSPWPTPSPTSTIRPAPRGRPAPPIHRHRARRTYKPCRRRRRSRPCAPFWGRLGLPPHYKSRPSRRGVFPTLRPLRSVATATDH